MKKSNRINYSIIVFLVILIGAIGISNTIAKNKAKYVWKMANVAPEAAFLAEFMKEEIIQRFERVTDGELSIDMYWGGIMGDEEDYIAKMRIGQLHGCGLSVGGVLMACPEMGVLQLPFLFNDYDEVDYIRNKLRKRFINIYKKNGYKMLLWLDQDFDQIYSTKYEMKNDEDFRKCRFLTHAGKLEAELIKALGASPIPVGVPEVVPSFRSGVCDTVISPALWWIGSQLYTITKYVNPYPFRYSPATLVVSNEAWNKLPLKHKKSIDIKMSDRDVEKRLNIKMHEINRDSLRAMINYGIKEVKMTEEEIKAFKKKSQVIWIGLAGKLYPKKLLDEVVYHLKQYRVKHTRKG